MKRELAHDVSKAERKKEVNTLLETPPPPPLYPVRDEAFIPDDADRLKTEFIEGFIDAGSRNGFLAGD
jgi:hypothetical protein